ncbi:NAD(P)/FAD-dependent oxidoreductase [Amycolatopsis sp. NPDC051061]|uniref:NAD(P)/FAD-dependent oxidoreductase n=1 Tax=Amycolatopsis sp. NPDC051061 TaxID=3155042 RepID=UPI00341AD9C5
MTLVVVGASLAGLRAVESARRTGYRGRIVLIGAEEHLPYDRPFHPETVLRDELGVELVLGAPAERLDADAREVTVAGRVVSYDAVVIATGATARGLPGARTLRTAEDAVAVRAALDDGARTVVVGAGFIGSEVASAARKRGLPVTIVEAAAVPLARAVGEAAGAELAGLHHAAGTELRLATEVTGVADDGVRLSTGEVLPADLVVAGIGAAPATGWLEGSGLTLHERDRSVVCDATLSAGPPGVSAGGTTLYRRGDRIVGALTVDRPREIMKYRRRVAARAAWAWMEEAPAFAGAA